MSEYDRPGVRPWRRTAASAIVALAALAGLALPASGAAAAELPGAITAVTTDKTTYGYDERIKLSFAWAVPDSASAGDVFALDLPAELRATSLATFPLSAPDGSIVAWGSWSGKSVQVTLTDYADTHDDVGGTGFVTVQWDHAVVPTVSAPIRLEFASNAVEVVIGDKPTPQPPCTTDCPPPPATPVARDLQKGGSWSDGSYEGTRDATGNISWWIRLPGSPQGFSGPITIVDAPAAGSVVECATIQLTTQLTLESGAVRSPLEASRYTVDCAPGGFTIVLDRIDPAEFIGITYKGTITDQLLGAYGNRVTTDIPGQPGERTVTMRRTAAGGDGGGVQSVSVGDLVWLDTDRDGRQTAGEPGIPGVVLGITGPDGRPVTDVSGTLVGPVTTDAAGKYSFSRLPVLAPGQSYTVTIDEAASADALDGLLSTKAGAGDDGALDSSTRTATSADLTTNGARDLTLDFGFVTFELPTLPVPEPPASPAQLASTGVEVLPTALVAATAGVLGLALLAGARRRRA